MTIKRTTNYEQIRLKPVRSQPKCKHGEAYVDLASFYIQDDNKVTLLRSHLWEDLHYLIRDVD